MTWPVTGLWCNLVEMLGIFWAHKSLQVDAAGSLGYGQYMAAQADGSRIPFP